VILQRFFSRQIDKSVLIGDERSLTHLNLFPLKIQLICYEDVDAWILGKFAKRMASEIGATFGIGVDIAKYGDLEASIGHHIIYYDVEKKWANTETFMITHLDELWKVKKVAALLKEFDMGICMSSDTRNSLIEQGLPPTKLCFVSPAHDLRIQPRRIRIGIASKTHADGRKLETELVSNLKKVKNKSDFTIAIMGSGWETQVKKLESFGFDVEYHPVFNYEEYSTTFIPNLDYFVYFSWDEGSMAFLDAIYGDIKTIVTPQGFHLDVRDGIDIQLNDFSDLTEVMNSFSEKRSNRRSRVKELTWTEYTWRHLLIWTFLIWLSNEDLQIEIMEYIKTHNENIEFLEVMNNRIELTSVPTSAQLQKVRQKLLVGVDSGSESKLSIWLDFMELVYAPDNVELRKKLDHIQWREVM
jgi:hypothetical protein